MKTLTKKEKEELVQNNVKVVIVKDEINEIIRCDESQPDFDYLLDFLKLKDNKKEYRLYSVRTNFTDGCFYPNPDFLILSIKNDKIRIEKKLSYEYLDFNGFSFYKKELSNKEYDILDYEEYEINCLIRERRERI